MSNKEKVKIIFVFALFSSVGTFIVGEFGLFFGIIIGTLYMILIELSRISSYLKELSSKNL
ncbi:hypothetical protein RFW18_20420 [Metabacillus idriensis]|uniref:hypothetical protein n=1 Tax=Metabacillus idriensis TaxID=324768 RepID=UPI002813552E|nr:hypothetical protein [Metabacillus idriensis]MDR0140131.1 hypothetical protein [Metabacillus idriensis]